jgi:hypothetical protein
MSALLHPAGLDDFDALLSVPDARAVALSYIERGWAPVPIPYREKGPQFKGWGLLRLSPATVSDHFTGGRQNIGVILGVGSRNLVDIDLDCEEACSLAPALLPPTPAVFGRQSRPASHWLYYSPDLVTKQIKLPGTLETLVELRSNSNTPQPSQTVFPGSTHPIGEAIEWRDATAEPSAIDSADMIRHFHKLAAATILARLFPSEGSGRHNATLALVGVLTRGGWSEPETVSFVKAIRTAAKADARKPLAKMARDAAARLKKDQSLYGRPTFAEAFGEKVADRIYDLLGLPTGGAPEIDVSVFDDLPPLGGATAKDPTTARLNRRHAVAVVRGRTLITTERGDSVDFGTARDLDVFYANDLLTSADGKTIAASVLWLRDPERRSYPDGVTFAPGGCAAGTLNLWRGWAVEPDANASCDLFLSHIRQVVCRGDAEHAAYVLGWLAHMVQRPDEKPGVGLVLKGGKGAGKDTVADYVARMIGRRHAPTVAETAHIVGQFNARLENALLLHVQEGSWAGDRKAEGVLKYLVTSDRVEIERKGIDSINLPSVLRLFISANADWVVPASPDERRWAVFEVSDARRGDEAYFNALRAEMKADGPAALLHFLSNYDLSGFDVRKAPDTEGLRNQKLASLRNIEAWWHATLVHGTISPDWGGNDGWGTGAVTVARETLRARYVEWMSNRRYDGDVLEERYFGRRLREMLPELKDARPRIAGGRVWQYALPPLDACRDAFSAWLRSPVDWDEGQ